MEWEGSIKRKKETDRRIEKNRRDRKEKRVKRGKQERKKKKVALET